MYKFKEGLNVKFNQKKASEIIGLTEASLSNILNRKVACRKVTAYCITKYINENAEIENYFDKVGE
jgi:plasmid maintenance system antidote protein VapI